MLNMNLLDTGIEAPVSRTVQNLDCGLWTGLWNLDLIFGPEFQLPGVKYVHINQQQNLLNQNLHTSYHYLQSH